MTMTAVTKRDNPSPWEISIYFDPQVNYLVRKTIYATSTDRGRFLREDEVLQFKECGPGLFFPERVVCRTSLNGILDFQCQTTISDIRLNEALPEGTFALSFRTGIRLTDTVENVRYRIDTRGMPISIKEPLPKTTPPPPLGDDPEFTGETEREPRTLAQWLVITSLCLLGMATVAASLRFLRRT